MDEIITIENPIFMSNSDAIDFCCVAGVLKLYLVCEKCNDRMLLVINNAKLNAREYRCTNNLCRARKSIYNGFNVQLPRLEIRKILFCLYFYVLELSNYQVVILSGVSEKSYISLKKIFLERIYAFEFRMRPQIGGNGIVFQVDETAVCRRRLIRNPTSHEFSTRDTVWLIGIIQEDNPRNLILEVLPNRKVETLTDFFSRNILSGSIIKSDGYPSYPRAINNAGCVHRVINHSEGFTNAQGEHTNAIENIWSHFKTELRTRRGIMLSNMNNFAKEFVIFRKYNLNRSKQGTSVFFKKVVESLRFEPNL